MNPEQEDFQQLRRLLALKRHEQPPPGYFEGFSRQVIVRIRAGERPEREPAAARLLWEVPWLQRLWGSLQARPAIAGAFGVLVCGVIISAAVFSEHGDAPQISLLSPSNSAPEDKPTAITQLTPVTSAGTELSSMSEVPTLPRSDSLFEEFRRSGSLHIQPLLQGSPQLEPVVQRISIGQ